MKLLITGAGGYIGSVLVRLCLEKGHDVVVLDRFFFGKDTLPEESSNLKIVEGDIRTVDSSIFEGVDGVIDLAAISNDPAGELDPTKDSRFRLGFVSTINLSDAGVSSHALLLSIVLNWIL